MSSRHRWPSAPETSRRIKVHLAVALTSCRRPCKHLNRQGCKSSLSTFTQHRTTIWLPPEPWHEPSVPRNVPVEPKISHRCRYCYGSPPQKLYTSCRIDARVSLRMFGSEAVGHTCFFSLMTLNLSKSVRFFLRSCCSLFFAQLLSAHFWSISCFSHNRLTGPVPAARGSFGITKGVR
jgi:hypothetical protein